MSTPLPAVRIRPIRPSDARLLPATMAALSAESVRRRFLAPKSALTRDELRYLSDVDGVDHVALVAVPCEDANRIVAVGRFVRDAEDPGLAEISIVVADDLQGRGLGRRLGLLLADEARARGVRCFTASMLSDNERAARVLETISRRMDSTHANGVRRLVAELAAA